VLHSIPTNPLCQQLTQPPTNPTDDTSPLTITHPLCTNSSDFLTNITWLGSGPQLYDTLYDPPASSAAECCQLCADNAAPEFTPQGPGSGCTGWLFNDKSPWTPCTRLVVQTEKQGAKKGKTCPKGYADETKFVKAGKGEVGFVAGVGPCGGKIIVT